MNELIYKSATALAAAIRRQEISSAEVVEACLARIEATNLRLNAVFQVGAESARREARAADAALAQGEIKGPLHGVPMTIKDSLDTAGMITTGGTTGRQNYVPARDATVVARMRQAGAILLGKTNTPELTLSVETDNLVYGRTNNPYDPARTPSGSSGGAAAVVAAGGSPLDLGSDTGGSIRQPAHCCGIAGLKPTAGRVPRTGHIINYDSGPLEALTQIGPMARKVEDLVLTLPIIAGPDGQDPAVVPVPLADPRTVQLNELRVAFFTDNGLVSPTPEIVRTIQTAAAALRRAGASVAEDFPAEIETTGNLWLDLVVADGAAWIKRLLREAGTTEVHSVIPNRFFSHQPVSSAEFHRMLARLHQVRRAMLAFVAAYDLILCPVNAFPALPHEAISDIAAGFSYTRIFNLTGWPAVVIRGGTSPEELPLGIQLVAQPWREEVALAAAGYLEIALGGWQPPAL